MNYFYRIHKVSADVNYTLFSLHEILASSQQCCQRFESSGTWPCVTPCWEPLTHWYSITS